ncbi:MAG: heterodisulfide reductase-related iron-sulfur binding cluster [Corynebacterium sp.]|nr:heterodisulfide reductase-related iron-sulfur binding cluster [Corynebacterium sp.]
MLSASEQTITTLFGVLGIVLSAPAWFLFIRAAAKLFRFITAGQPEPGRWNQPIRRLWTMFKEIFFHTEMMRKPAVAIAHWFVMLGFLIGSLVWFEAYIQTFNPAGGWPVLSKWHLYHCAEEILALGTVVGISYLWLIRIRSKAQDRMSRFYGSNAKAAYFVEAVVFTEGLGMLMVKAAKIATYGHSSVWADFATRQLAHLLPASPVLVSFFALIKLLTGMIWLVVVARRLTWGVAWHRFLAFFNIFFRRYPDGHKALGAVAPMRSGDKELTMETIEEDDIPGVGSLTDASWKMLLDVSTCTECGRCQEQCPAWNTEKPLSPKLFIRDIRDAAVAHADYLQNPVTFAADNSHAGVDVLSLVGESAIVHPDVLWSCTNCGACVEQCPVDIEHIDHITNLRRFQVLAESQFPSELTGLFKNLETKGNPWGRNSSERKTWIEEARRDGLEVPIFGEDVTDFADIEYLYWVGCAGAFDDDGKKTTRAVVELLHTAGISFAVLSKGETCTGDPARRAGNEFLFQMLAAENIATLDEVFAGVPEKQRKIITTCPHCFNTIRNEYPDFDGHYEVFHHTQLLNRLVREKRLTPIPRRPEDRAPITYHDPCFLGRHNKVFDPPRELIAATGANLLEMDRNRDTGFCCGAGGARMFMEENLGTRINENRTAEAIETGAETIAVGCPFCNTMLTSGVKAMEEEKTAQPAVKDVAQMLRDSVLVDGKLPEPHPKQFLGERIRLSPHATPRDAVQATQKPAKQQITKTATPSTPTPPVPPAAAPATPATPIAGSPIPPGAPSAPGMPAAPGVPSVPTTAHTPGIPVSGNITPASDAPTPGSTAPTPGSAVPTPGASVPTPGAAAPTPKSNAPVPGSAIPTPGATIPQTPEPTAPSIPTPDSAVPAPGAATPQPSAPAPNIPTPGIAVPTPNNAVQEPQSSTPPPTPGVPVPDAPAPSLNSAAPTPASAVPVPNSSLPTPQSAVPTPGGAAPTSEAATPLLGVPTPGSAVPVPPTANPAPGAREQKSPKTETAEASNEES